MPKATEILRKSAQYPVGLCRFFDLSPPRLWYVGEPSILNGKLLGIISSRKIEPGLALKSFFLIRELASETGTFVGGWHSPLEEEVLRILLSQSTYLIFCLAKSLNKFSPSEEIIALINRGRVLLLTHCSPTAKRISREASLRRNKIIAGLARGLLILSGPEGSTSYRLARDALRLGRPVFTLPHPMNHALLGIGAQPATIESLRGIFR